MSSSTTGFPRWPIPFPPRTLLRRAVEARLVEPPPPAPGRAPKERDGEAWRRNWMHPNTGWRHGAAEVQTVIGERDEQDIALDLNSNRAKLTLFRMFRSDLSYLSRKEVIGRV
jgi:hypothetical protein